MPAAIPRLMMSAFVQFDQRRVDAKHVAFDTRFRREIRQPFERIDEFGPAVRITGVIDRVDADEDVARAEHFTPAERVRRERSCCAPART